MRPGTGGFAEASASGIEFRKGGGGLGGDLEIVVAIGAAEIREMLPALGGEAGVHFERFKCRDRFLRDG